MKSKFKSKFGTHVFRQKGSMKSQGSLRIWIWIPCSASSIMFVSPDLPNSSSRIQVQRWQTGKLSEEWWLSNSREIQMPKQENHLHLNDRHAQPRDKEGAPRLTNFTKHPLQTFPIICKNSLLTSRNKRVASKMNSNSDHLGQFPPRQYCLSCSCKLLLSHQSNKWGYTLCSAPLWGYCMIYQDDHKMSKKL